MAILNHARSSQSRVSSFAWPDFGPRAVRFQAARVRLTDPPARAAFFFRSSDDVAFKADATKRISHHLSTIIVLPERHLVPQMATTTNEYAKKKRIRHRALCDRTRPKRDRNETHRVCERKHGTCFSSVFVRSVRARESFSIYYYLFSAFTIWIPRFDIRLLPLSVLSSSKGKKDPTAGTKRESERALSRSYFL